MFWLLSQSTSFGNLLKFLQTNKGSVELQKTLNMTQQQLELWQSVFLSWEHIFVITFEIRELLWNLFEVNVNQMLVPPKVRVFPFAQFCKHQLKNNRGFCYSLPKRKFLCYGKRFSLFCLLWCYGNHIPSKMQLWELSILATLYLYAP